MSDFWSKVPRFGVRPKVWQEPHHEVDRLQAERGPLNKEDRPEPMQKDLAKFKKRLVARNKARARKGDE